MGAGHHQARALIQKSLDEVYAVDQFRPAASADVCGFRGDLRALCGCRHHRPLGLGTGGAAGRCGGVAAYKQAFQGYIGRKYGKRFREFIGSKIKVTGAKKVKSFYAVTSVAYLKGRSPMEVEVACLGQVRAKPLFQHHHRGREHAGLGAGHVVAPCWPSAAAISRR